MANIDAPFGLRPVRHLDGSPYNGATTRYFVPASDSTAVFIGDAVTSAGNSTAEGVPIVQQAAVGNTILGVCVSVEPETSESTSYRAASVGRFINVVDAPDVIYQIQEDSVGNTIPADRVGNNYDLIVGSGNTTTGTSTMEIDSSATSGASTAQLRLLGLSQLQNNEIGTNAVWDVLINEHFFKTTTGA